jgi:hypothetical protein
MHPIEHLNAPVASQTGERRMPTFINDDGTDWPICLASLGTLAVSFPRGMDDPNEIHTFIATRRQRDSDLSWAQFRVWTGKTVRHRTRMAENIMAGQQGRTRYPVRPGPGYSAAVTALTSV